MVISGMTLPANRRWPFPGRLAPSVRQRPGVTVANAALTIRCARLRCRVPRTGRAASDALTCISSTRASRRAPLWLFGATDQVVGPQTSRDSRDPFAIRSDRRRWGVLGDRPGARAGELAGHALVEALARTDDRGQALLSSGEELDRPQEQGMPREGRKCLLGAHGTLKVERSSAVSFRVVSCAASATSSSGGPHTSQSKTAPSPPLDTAAPYGVALLLGQAVQRVVGDAVGEPLHALAGVAMVAGGGPGRLVRDQV